MTNINQKEYLKKYLALGKAPGEKKKKKKKEKPISNRLKIIDDDVDVLISKEIEDDLSAANEDAPQIVAIIDERPPSLQVDENTKSNLWKPIGEPSNETDIQTLRLNSFRLSKQVKSSDDGLSTSSIKREYLSVSHSRYSSFDSRNESALPKIKQENYTDLNISRVSSPSSKKRDDNSKHHVEKETSPSKKRFNEDYLPINKGENYDHSPPRKSQRKNDSYGRKHRERSSSPKTRMEDRSPLRKRNIDDSTSLRKNDRESDHSPPRRKIKQESTSPPKRRNGEDDYSPPRRKYKEEHNSPRRKNNEDRSPRRKGNNEYNSLPRRKSNEDRSPDRRRNNVEDNSPPRRKNNEDRSPRRKINNERDNSSSERQNLEKDSSPPRRPNKERDNSPPRRKNKDDNSSFSKERNNHFPHRRYEDIETSPKRRNEEGNMSPLREQKRKGERPKRTRWTSEQPLDSSLRDKMKKTLDGKQAGLQNAEDLLKESKFLRQKEDAMFQNMSAEVSGRNAATVIRGKKVKDLEEEAAKEKRQKEMKEKYDRWGKGLKQVEDQNKIIEEQLHEMTKPLARYADDEDLEKFLKEQEREGDPMLNYIRKKKKKERVAAGIPEKPMYMGEFMPNRFGIRPGFRWDGVDRSNGYEKKWFQVQNAKKANREEAFKWSTEDM